MIIVAGIATTLFLGGWLRPFARNQDHLFGTSVELLNILPTLLFLATAAVLFLAHSEAAREDSENGDGAGRRLCLILAVVMTAALFAPEPVMLGIHGAFWFLAKVFAYIYVFLWVRFTFPRYRFDQLMSLGWRFLIPLALVNVIVVATTIVLQQNWEWRHPMLSAIVTTAIMLGVAAFLAKR